MTFTNLAQSLTFSAVATLAIAFAGCSDDDSNGNAAQGGNGGAQSGTGGASGGSGGDVGGGPPISVPCEDGLRLLATDVVGATKAKRVPGSAGVVAFVTEAGVRSAFVHYAELDVLEPEGTPKVLRRFVAADLGLTSLQQVVDFAVSADQVFVVTPDVVGVGHFDGRAGFSLPSQGLRAGAIAVADGVIAVSSHAEFAVATRADDEWTWGPVTPFPEGRVSHVVGAGSDELLVSMHEMPTTDRKVWVSAEILRMSFDGEIIERHATRGNVSAVMPYDGGLILSELNSFWGSYQAAIEWLGPIGSTIRTLTNVPVISSTDGSDGAFATAILESESEGKVLYVANGESRLLRGAWSSDAVQLAPVPGPWDGPSARGSMVTSIAAIGDVLIVPGYEGKLHFLESCSNE